MMSFNKTFLPTSDYQNRNWFIIDCRGQTLGRLSTLIATLLKGKLKPHYHPSVDMGDYVILINADLILRNEDRQHYLVANPGRPGSSLKIKNVANCRSIFTIERTVKGMLAPTEKKRLMKRLSIYKDQYHRHQAQNPIHLDLSKLSFQFPGMEEKCLHLV